MILAYHRMGLLHTYCKQGMRMALGRATPTVAYNGILVEVERKLRKKYLPILNALDGKYGKDIITGKHLNKVWVCWLQGIDNAPDLVKTCYASLNKYLKDCEIVLLTNENIHDYVQLPDFIEEKHKRGIIPVAQYTDLLRLELLIRYGGTWIDSTVLCTGYEEFNSSSVHDFLDSELFLFQRLRKDETRFLGISNWFITSCADNWVLKVLRDMLYQYWRDYDCVVHYYVFHLFFTMIMEKHPEVAAKMPKHGNSIPHYLSRRMGDVYDEEWMQELKRRTCFHKLSYRLDDSILGSKGTFYDVMIKQTRIEK